MTKVREMSDNHCGIGLDPRLAQIVRLLARAAAKHDYQLLLESGVQPHRRDETET